MARYHPLYDGIWEDEAFDATGTLPRARFEEIAFFVFLFGNTRQRPSGIYRVTDEQLALDTRLPLPRVRNYVKWLGERRRIVRDGSWMFVRGYFARQPKQTNLIRAVELDLAECSSQAILEAFDEKYPAFRRPSADRRRTVNRPSTDRRPTVEDPSLNRAEQFRAEQSRAVEGQPTVPHGTGSNGHDLTPDEERGLEYIAAARGISVAQARSEMLTAKLRDQRA